MIVRVLTDVYCSQSFFFFWSVFQVAAAYFAFSESLFSCHLSFVLSLDKTTFMLVVGSLESGLKDSEKISSQVCNSLAHFLVMIIQFGIKYKFLFIS